MIDLEVLRPIVEEIRELRRRIRDLEREHDRIVFDALGIHTSVDEMFADKSYHYNSHDRREHELMLTLHSKGYSAEDIGFVLNTWHDHIERQIQQTEWLKKAPQLKAFLEKFGRRTSYQLMKFWSTCNITTVQQALAISDKTYLSLDGFGKKALTDLLRALAEA